MNFESSVMRCNGILVVGFLCLFCGQVFAWIAPSNLPGMEEADQLIYYFQTLAVKGQVAKIGKEGLLINGPNLQGDWVRCPSDALARATEMYAEHANEKKDIEKANKRTVG